MPKENWGVKRVCPTTGKRFYDMNRSPIVSPYTGEVVALDTARTRTMLADKPDKDAASKDQVEKDEAVIEDDDDTTDVDLGDDVLDDDDEDEVSLDEIADVAAEGED